MSRIRIAVAAAVVVIGTQVVMADVWNKLTKVTFNRAVEVPGAVLPAGTYTFKLVDSSSARHVVQIQNTRGDKTYATILAIPDYRVNASSRTVMYFGETGASAGSPVAIKSWFYPGDNYGQRFVYPKKAAVQIATVYHQPVPTAETPTPAAPVVITTPEKKEVAYQPQVFEKVDTQDTSGVDGEAVKEPAKVAAAPPEPAPEPKKLPATSSPLPLMAGLGGLLLATSGVLRYMGSRSR